METKCVARFKQKADGVFVVCLGGILDTLQNFISQVKARSDENANSFALLYANGNYSVCIGLMRQELDSLLRLCYLWRPETKKEEALSLINDSIQGKRWSYRNASGKIVSLTDREMLSFASFLGGWEQIVYKFGCKAIHLSELHSYKTTDPLEFSDEKLKDEMIKYLMSYHGYGKKTITMPDLYYYLPMVMKKLIENVEFYIDDLSKRYACT